MSWKTYPHVAPWGDPKWFTFPDCDGDGRRLATQTYFVDGFLRGKETGTQYAFLTVFTDARLFDRTQRFSFFSLAFFDCDRGRYGTSTDFDFPHPESAEHDRLAAAPQHLDLRWKNAAGMPPSVWRNQRNADRSLRPFAWTVELHAVDHHGARMALELEIEAERPPAPLGGPELGGEMMFLGEEQTFSYFQSGLRMRGRLGWGDVAEEVEGTVGWIDRQWSEENFARHQDPGSSRYRNEWRVIQLDNGWDLSCFHQYRRDHRNAVVPWTGVSAQGPEPGFEVRGTHRFEMTVPEFIRSPGVVRALLMLSEGPRWFPARYRLQVPEWDLDLEGEPLVEAPAHGFPIEWWSGPVRIEGRMFGERVSGLGFDERANPRVRGFEIAEALRISADHLGGVDIGAAADSRRARRKMLSYRAWEVEALCLRGDPGAAARHFERFVNPSLDVAADGQRIGDLAADLLAVLRSEEEVK